MVSDLHLRPIGGAATSHPGRSGAAGSFHEAPVSPVTESELRQDDKHAPAALPVRTNAADPQSSSAADFLSAHMPRPGFAAQLLDQWDGADDGGLYLLRDRAYGNGARQILPNNPYLNR